MPIKFKPVEIEHAPQELQSVISRLAEIEREASKVSSVWIAHGESILKSQRAARNLARLFEDQHNILNAANEGHNRLLGATRAVGGVFSHMARDTKEIAKNLGSMTVSLINMVSITGIIGGLIGFGGGLFGMESIASGVSSNRRQAMGMGVNYGKMLAFGTNFSRFGNARGTLSNVATGMYDMTSPEYLALNNAGVLGGGDAADTAERLMSQLPSLFAGTPENQIGARASSLGLTEIMSVRDIVAYLHASPEERRTQIDRYRQDSKTFQLSKDSQQKWANFDTTLTRAEISLTTILERKLVQLEPGLEQLSGDFVKFVMKLSDSKGLDLTVEKFNSGIKWLSDTLMSEEFIEGEQRWVRVFGEFTSMLLGFAGSVMPILSIVEDLISSDGSKTWNQIIERAFPTDPNGPPSPGSIHDHNSTESHPIDPKDVDLSRLVISAPAGETQDQLTSRIQALYPYFGHDQCVQLAMGVAGIKEGVRQWEKGPGVLDQDLPIGTPVATFLDDQGNQSDRYAGGGIGTPRANRDHAGIIAGYVPGGVVLADQWQGSGGWHYDTYMYNDPRGGEKDAKNYHAIFGPNHAPAGTANPYLKVWEQNHQLVTPRAWDNILPNIPTSRSGETNRDRMSSIPSKNRVAFADTLQGAKTPKYFHVDNHTGSTTRISVGRTSYA